MLYNAENGLINIDDTTIEYTRFGGGKRILVMLPGLGEGLRSIKGTAFPMAVMYRLFADEFTVYSFGRKNVLPQGYTTREMARDVAEAMEQLGIAQADILGVSMGGMIAQHLATDYPQKVGKLVLVVTSARPNPILMESIEEWVSCAKADDHTALMESNLRRIYSEAYYRKNSRLIPVLGRMTKPKSYDRFLIQADACLTHNAYEKLPQILAQTLVIGGEKDLSLGGEPSGEIAARIPNAALHMYAQWGHGLYEEAKDFNQRVYDFLMNS